MACWTRLGPTELCTAPYLWFSQSAHRDCAHRGSGLAAACACGACIAQRSDHHRLRCYHLAGPGGEEQRSANSTRSRPCHSRTKLANASPHWEMAIATYCPFHRLHKSALHPTVRSTSPRLTDPSLGANVRRCNSQGIQFVIPTVQARPMDTNCSVSPDSDAQPEPDSTVPILGPAGHASCGALGWAMGLSEVNQPIGDRRLSVPHSGPHPGRWNGRLHGSQRRAYERVPAASAESRSLFPL
jgi:hypothetical protein